MLVKSETKANTKREELQLFQAAQKNKRHSLYHQVARMQCELRKMELKNGTESSKPLLH